MQEEFKFNNLILPNMSEDGYIPSFAVTSTSDSGRTMRGTMRNSVLFTVQAFKLKWTKITPLQVSQILHEILGKDGFAFHYYSVYYNQWLTEQFYVANVNDIKISCLMENSEHITELSFQVTGTNPI